MTRDGAFDCVTMFSKYSPQLVLSGCAERIPCSGMSVQNVLAIFLVPVRLFAFYGLTYIPSSNART
ncbi:hypothetical protein BDN67DRAFT_970174 [Paxillus ammoniavirescens]|nr:hypothetical protein BDN67DRAFT_970174 [Paxillus ammoniavirescens]